MNATGCPDQAELFDFARGRLAAPRFARVAEHVEHCPACGESLQAFDSLADPLLDRLRQPAIPATLVTDSVPSELVAAAQAARTTCRATGWLPEGKPGRLGRFELLEELGQGSFGLVYRARDTELGRTVAIKILRACRLGGREDVDWFLREARSAARLQHPGIVSLYETGQADDGTCYLVEEFIGGTTLASRLNTGRPSFREAADLVAAVAEALHYAHRNGVIHRDLKPSNIMLDADGRPHLMDFGLAKREADDTPVTLDGQVLGTPAYMSPEQARGESHRVDARSDVYSLGVILYELLTGERPFRGNRRMLLLQVLHDEPRPPRQLHDKVPRDLETVCLKAMAKVPARRYATAQELADDLRRFLTGEPIRARPVGAWERGWNWTKRRPAPAALVGVSVLAALLLVAVLTVSNVRIAGEQQQTKAALAELTRVLGRERRANEELLKALVQNARLTSDALTEFNELYASEVVARVRGHGVEVTHDYAGRPGAIPLPATLSVMLGQRIGNRCARMQVRLYSDHPFPWRRDEGGPRDDFEREALRQLRERPDEPFYRFEDWRGQPSLRYATASRMRASCIECHNTHADSPKTDWKEGDVRGVFEVIFPVDAAVVQFAESSR